MKWYCTVLLVLAAVVSAWAQPAGPNNSTNIFDGGGGIIPEPWTNPNLARTQNNAYATLVTTTISQRTGYLQCQNFGFNIPAGSGIDGIVVEIDRYATVTLPGGTVNDERIRIIDATGAIIAGSDKSEKPTGLSWPVSDADPAAYQSYGGMADKWSLTNWTSAKINDANFGVAIAARTSSTNGATFNMFVDEVRITVYYTVGGSQRYAVASGLWSQPSSWATTPGGTPGLVVAPTATDDVFIGGGFTITQDVSGASCNSLTIGTTETTPTGNLTFVDNDNRNIDIGPAGLVITANGDVLSTFTPRLTTAGDFTLNKTLTNRVFEVRMDGSGTEIITGTGSLGSLNVQTFTTITGNIAITAKLAGPAQRLINGGTGYLNYSGTTASMDNNVLDLTTTGNTIEFSQTTTDAPDFNIQKASNSFYNLIISGDAPKDYNGDITVNGDLTITSTGILRNQNSRGITLYGNWSNSNGAAGFVPNSCGACTVNFLGGNPQSITNAAGEQFHRIEVNKTAGTTVTAANNIVLDDRLLMTQGNLDIGSNTFTGTASVNFEAGELLIGTTGSTVPALTGTYTLNGGTITFNGAGAQTIRSTASTPAITSYVNVQFLGSGTKSLSGAITASGNLTIGGTATLDVTASNFAISLAGNWANSSSFSAQIGTVTFNGTATQSITNAAGETFYNLTVNNSTASNAITLGGPVTVSNTMTFTDGHIASTASNLLTLEVNATVASVSDGSHVVGPVAKVKNTTAQFAFPVGNGSNYMPASVTPTSTTSTTYRAQYFSVEQTQGATLGAGVDHISSQDYWTVERTTGTADAAVTLSWEYASAADSEINSIPDLLVAQWDGALWASRGNAATTGNTTVGTVLSNTITSFTQPYFVIGSSTTANPLSNDRYFVAATGNWPAASVWAYRSGGAASAPEPTSTKNVIIVAGNTATVEDTNAGTATKSMLSLTINGTIAMSDVGGGQDITLSVGTGGLTIGSAGNVTGADNGDRIRMAGNITLNNIAGLSHTVMEVDFTSQSHTISGTGSLPILRVNQNNQLNTGTISVTNLIMSNTLTNNSSITVTDALSGPVVPNGNLINGATGTIIWQGTSIANRTIDASAIGNTVQLINNAGANIDLDEVVSGATFHHLTLSGANGFDQSKNLDINGNLTILSGGVFNNASNNPNRTLNIGGNWLNNNGAGGFLEGANGITFDGSSAQSISISPGNENEVFQNLIINNTSPTGVTITSGEVHVTSNLTLTDGIVFTGAANLLVIRDNATSNGGSAASFVDGPMKKIGNEAFVFPVGDGATWARLGMASVSNFDATTEFTCQYLHSGYSNTSSLDASLFNVSTIEHWLLDRVFDIGNNASCKVRLFWESESASAISFVSDLRVGHYYAGGSGLKWYSFGDETGGTDNGDGSGSILSTMFFTSFSPITFGSEIGVNPLPIELISFTATLEDKAVVLSWKTASELNNDFFTIERSWNGRDFDSLLTVDGAGTSNVIKAYSAVDGHPYGGLSYYRLKQTDYDGAKSYSNVIAVRRPESVWSVYPNPNDGTSVHLQVPEGQAHKPVQVIITDMQGSTLFQHTYTVGPKGDITLDLNQSLRSGVYLLYIKDGPTQIVKRLSVLR